MPHRVWQLELAAQQKLQKILFEQPKCHRQTDGHGCVQNGWFPFDEAIVMQQQREAAKHQHQREGDFLHHLQPLVHGIDQPHLHRGRSHQHGCGGVNVIGLVGAKKKQHRKKVEQNFHIGWKCKEAEFMQ